MNLVILGAPGAGKGAQSRNLSKHYSILHISTGDMLRHEMEIKSPIGISIEERMNKGELVPDDVVTELLKERLRSSDASKGIILDGYPRNLYQAEIMESFVVIDKVISIDVPDEVIVSRMSGRLICPNCGASFNIHYHPPIKKGICDVCGTKLVKRDDDKAKTVKKRLKTYHKETEPIKEFFRKKSKLVEIDGTNDIEVITEEIIKALGDV